MPSSGHATAAQIKAGTEPDHWPLAGCPFLEGQPAQASPMQVAAAGA
jgi:hypothetical protein